jgi:hypothetical protein
LSSLLYQRIYSFIITLKSDKFYQQVIEAENHNARNEVTHPRLIFFDPSDLRETCLKGKPVILIFHADTTKGNSTIHYPMQRHPQSWFQMLRHKVLNEVIATDTYFACE